MKDPKAIKKLKQKNVIEGLKKVEHPHKTSFAIAIFLYCLISAIAIMAWCVSGVNINSAMLTSSLIGMALTFI